MSKTLDMDVQRQEGQRAIEHNFTIGEYSIYPSSSEGKIWINHISGEGGEFSEKDFVEMVAKFYNDNF